VQQGQLVPQDQKVLWEKQDVEVLLVSKEPQEDLVVQAQLDLLVTKEGKVRQVHQDLEVEQEMQDHRDLRDLQVKLVNQDCLVLKVTLDQVAQKE